MNLIRAETKAKYLAKELEPFCDRIEIVGNIRRRKQPVNKIEILLAPRSVTLFGLMTKIVELGSEDGIKAASKKTIILKDELERIEATLYFTSLDKWPVTLLVKTGGNKSNQRIATLCENKKWQLSVSEGAIYDENGRRLPIKYEDDIYKLLGIPYIEPSWRE